MGTIFDQQTIPKSPLFKVAKLTPSAANVNSSKNNNSNSLNKLSFNAKLALVNSYNLNEDYHAYLKSYLDTVAGPNRFKHTPTLTDKIKSKFSSFASLTKESFTEATNSEFIKNELNSIDKISSTTTDFVLGTVKNTKGSDVRKFIKSNFNLCKDLRHPERLKGEIDNILKNKPNFLPANLRSGLASLNKELCGDPEGAIVNGDPNNPNISNIVNAMMTVGNRAGLHIFSCNISVKQVSKLITNKMIQTATENAEVIGSGTVNGIVTKTTGDAKLSNAVVNSLNDTINGKGLDVHSVLKVACKHARKSKEGKKLKKSILSTVKTAVKSTFNRKKSNKVLISDSGDKKTNKDNVEFLASALGKDKYNSSKHKKTTSESTTIAILAKKMTKETTGDENNLDTKPILDTTTKIATLTGINKNKTFMI